MIQVSAHSSMNAARQIEDKLRAMGHSAYTSETTIGNDIFYRVRVRGFNDKKSAENTLAKIKSADMGHDGYILTLD